MKSKGFIWVAITLATILTIGLTNASAADYPKRPITLICPWGAGGGTDAVSRIIATLLKKELGVPVNVPDRPALCTAVLPAIVVSVSALVVVGYAVFSRRWSMSTAIFSRARTAVTW